MIRTRRVTGCRPDAPVLLGDKVHVAQALRTTITPLTSHLLVETFCESLSQPIGEGFRHDCVVVVVLGPEPVAQILQADPARNREGSDMVRQAGFLWRNEVGERAARLATFPVGLLAEEVESFGYFFPLVVRVQLDIIARGIGGEKTIYAARRDQFLLNDDIEKSVGFCEYLPRLPTLLLVIKNAGIHTFQSPGVKQRCPVDELA